MTEQRKVETSSAAPSASSAIAPVEPPYAPDVAAAFDEIMPPGVAPLVLFRVMARNPRVFRKIRAGSLLDRGSLTLREREIIILRRYLELDMNEIRGELGLPSAGATRMLLSRAQVRLADLLTREMNS